LAAKVPGKKKKQKPITVTDRVRPELLVNHQPEKCHVYGDDDVLNYQFWKFSESSDSSKKNHSWCNPHVFTAEIPTFEAIEPYLFITLHHSEPAPPPRTGYIMLHL